jgi:hypothetical protein
MFVYNTCCRLGRKFGKNVTTKNLNPNVLSLSPYVGSQGVGCCQVLNHTLSSHYNCSSLLEHLLFQKYIERH